MTEGRFETIHNLRPKNWDDRRHWTNWHHLYDCEKDHQERESCPFHDLRAGGQFQYEHWGAGPYDGIVEPARLNDRPNGDRMDFAKGKGTQVGGLGDIPLDTEPGRPTKHNTHPGRTHLYTKKDPLKRGLFSEFPYMPEGPSDNAPLTGAEGDDGLAGPGKPRVGTLKAGGPVNFFGQQPEYIPDPYKDKIDHGRIYHFHAGKKKNDDRPPWMPEGEPEKRKKKSHGPFYAGKKNGFTLGGDPEWIPDPYDKGRIKNDRRPFRTWHTRTKWSMPTHAPWSTGLSTAEPVRGKNFDSTTSALPNLRTSGRVNLTQTIGKEAALSSTR